MLYKKFQLMVQVVGCVTIGLLAVWGLLGLLGGASPTWAAIGHAAPLLAPQDTPVTLNYQGFLRKPDGNLTTGTYTITARIYDLASGPATPLYETTVPNVTVRDGLFNIVLGDDPALDPGVFDDVPRYIGISLNSDPELMPRQRLHAVPWAYAAKTLVANATVNTLTVDWLASNNNITAAGNINAGSLTVTGEIDAGGLTIDGNKPFLFKSLTATVNQEATWHCTGIPQSEYTCAIAGFDAGWGDLQEDDPGDLLEVRIWRSHPLCLDDWSVYAKLRTHINYPDWQVDIMCVRNELVDASGYTPPP